MQFDYSTQTIEPKLRRQYWNDVVCKHFIPSYGMIDDKDNGLWRFRGLSLGPVLVAETIAPQRSWERTIEHIHKFPDEDFVMVLIEDGIAVMSQNGHTVTLNKGDIAIYDASKPFTHSFYGNHTYTMRIPRALLLTRFPAVEQMINTKIAEMMPMSMALGSLLKELCSLPDASPTLAKARFASGFLDTLTASMEFQFLNGKGDETAIYNGLLTKATAFIDSQLDNFDINVESIAFALHVSPRTLSRAFARHDTTLMRHLWDRRLAKSYQLLIEGRVTQVSQAAYQCGFSDLSHYSRTFKKRYGESPSVILMNHNQTKG